MLTGVFVQELCVEAFDGIGRLLYQSHHRRHEATAENLSLFVLPPDAVQLSRMHSSLRTMSDCRFKIERVVGHLLEPSDGFMEHDALHLTLAIHSAMKQWADYWSRRAQNPNDTEAADARRQQGASGLIRAPSEYRKLRKVLDTAVTQALDEAEAGDRIRRVVGNAIANANNASLLEKVRMFLEGQLGMTLTEEDFRALGYRNQIAHEGGFAVDFVDLSYEQMNERHIDINRLRNIANEVVLRLCGYVGGAHDYCPPLAMREIGHFKALLN